MDQDRAYKDYPAIVTGALKIKLFCHATPEGEIEKLGQALDLLLELSRDRQVLLFTCQKREAERLAGLDGVRVMGLGK